jgi:alkylhydroperoxidase family enzyme
MEHTMRIEPVTAETAHPYSMEVWQRAGQEIPDVLHLVRLWAWSPWLQEQHQRLGHTLHNRTSLDRRLKELAIVRVCTRNYSAYELFHHVPLALDSGLTRAEIAAIQSFTWPDAECLSEEQRACLQYVDEFDAGRGVQLETVRRLKGFLDAGQIVAISLQAGYWSCNARFTKTLQAEFEPNRVERHTRMLNDLYHDNTPAPRRAPQPVPEDEPEGSRIGLVSWETASPKSRQWFDRWPGGYAAVPNLVKAWAWSDNVQAASQLVWEALEGPHTKLAPRLRTLVARRVAWRNYSPYLLELLQRTSALADADLAAVQGDFETSPALSGLEKSVLRFVDAWDSGLAVGDELFEPLRAALDRQELVEIQLNAGFFGTQARFAEALKLIPEATDNTEAAAQRP